MIRVLILVLACAAAHGAEPAQIAAGPAKIAVLDVSAIEELVRVRILAKPEHAETKAKLLEVEKRSQELQREFHKAMSAGEAEKAAAMERMGALHQEKSALEKRIEHELKGGIITAVKEATKGRYVVVLDANYAETIVTKDAELVDVTIDVREHLLTR